MPSLSVIIVNYNTQDRLKDCLESLIALDQRELEIIVVDNASPDDSVAMIKRYPQVTLIALEQNTWFSGGNNIGMQAAQSDYVCLLNPDTLVTDDMLTTMLSYLQSHDEVGAVTCRQVHPEGDLLPICSRERHYIDLVLAYTFIGHLLPSWRTQRQSYTFYADWQRDSSRQVDVIPGSNLMARRADLISFGGFDEHLHLYFTDDDLCQDIRRLGKTLYYLADITLYHYERSSVRDQNRLARHIYFHDMLVYSRKHHGILLTFLLRLLLIPTRIIAALR